MGWRAAYNQAIVGEAKGIPADNHEAAVNYADDVVSETQGFASAEYISNSEYRTKAGKLFLMWYGYFNNQGNMLVTEAKDIARQDTSIAAKSASAFYLYLMCYMAPSFMADLIGAAMRDSLPTDDDDDGTMLDDWFEFFAISQARYLGSMTPYGRDIANVVIGKYTDAPWDDEISLSPVTSVLQRVINSPVSLYKAMFEDGDASKAMKETMTALGMMGVPVGFLTRPVTYAADVAEGDTDIPDGAAGGLEVMRGVLAGPSAGGGNSGGK